MTNSTHDPLPKPVIGCRISSLLGFWMLSKPRCSPRRKVAKQKLGSKLVTNTEAHLANTLFKRTSVDDEQLAGSHGIVIVHAGAR